MNSNKIRINAFIWCMHYYKTPNRECPSVHPILHMGLKLKTDTNVSESRANWELEETTVLQKWEATPPVAFSTLHSTPLRFSHPLGLHSPPDSGTWLPLCTIFLSPTWWPLDAADGTAKVVGEVYIKPTGSALTSVPPPPPHYRWEGRGNERRRRQVCRILPPPHHHTLSPAVPPPHFLHDCSADASSLTLLREVEPVLTPKFGKPRSHHRPRVSIGFRVLESADENYQSPVVEFLMDSVKEINQLKEAYPEETEFEKDATWQVIY